MQQNAQALIHSRGMMIVPRGQIMLQVRKLEHKIHTLHTALEADPEDKILLKKLGPLEQRYQDLGGYTIEGTAKKILSGLGFEENQFHTDFNELSGGCCMRIYIARLLLQNPDLLLLDEPTNHLDMIFSA